MKKFDHSRNDFTPYGFTCEEWTPSIMMRPDRHNEIEMNMVFDGTISYLIGGAKVIVPTYHLILFWAAIPHQIIAHSSTQTYYVITIPLAWFLQWRLPDSIRDPVLHGRIVQECIRKSWRLETEIAKRWKQDMETRSTERHELALMEIEARIRRTSLKITKSSSYRKSGNKRYSRHYLGSGDISKAETMACFIAQNYQKKLTATDIGNLVGLHANYAMTLFKNSFDTTLNEYLIQHRLSHSQRLLVTTDEKILSIAFESGFGTLSRFNDAFKTAFKCTPKVYRNMHRPNL